MPHVTCTAASYVSNAGPVLGHIPCLCWHARSKHAVYLSSSGHRIAFRLPRGSLLCHALAKQHPCQSCLHHCVPSGARCHSTRQEGHSCYYDAQCQPQASSQQQQGQQQKTWFAAILQRSSAALRATWRPLHASRACTPVSPTTSLLGSHLALLPAVMRALGLDPPGYEARTYWAAEATGQILLTA